MCILNIYGVLSRFTRGRDIFTVDRALVKFLGKTVLAKVFPGVIRVAGSGGRAGPRMYKATGKICERKQLVAPRVYTRRGK